MEVFVDCIRRPRTSVRFVHETCDVYAGEVELVRQPLDGGLGLLGTVHSDMKEALLRLRRSL